MAQSDYIEILIPTLTPGANRTYLPVRKDRAASIILTDEARSWDKGAALIVGSAAGQFDFEPDLSADYEIIIRWWGGRHDADAHQKLVQDTITRKLGFDDRQIKTAVIQRLDDWGEDEPEGIQVHLFKALERPWVSSIILERLGILADIVKKIGLRYDSLFRD